MVEAAVCLAVFAPVVLTAVRLAVGANQVHQLEAAVTEAAKAAGACGDSAAVFAAASAHLPGLEPGQLRVFVEAVDPPTVHVTIEGYPVQHLRGAEPLNPPPSARFPYACE